MKKIFFAALTLLAVLPGAHAGCNFSYKATDAVDAVVKAHGGWRLNDAQCAVLNKKKLTLIVDTHATVLDGVSVAWANVTLVDAAFNIKADSRQFSTHVQSKKASMNVAEKMEYEAITNALDGYDFTEAAKQIDAYRAKAAASFKQPAKR